MSRPADTALFLRAFARDPLHTAAVVPSSPALASAMTRSLPVTGEPVVVELGRGTGASTTAIQDRLGGRGRHVAIERDESWAGLLARRHAEVDVVHGDAHALRHVLAERGIARADAVVSGLPWVACSPGQDGRSRHAGITASSCRRGCSPGLPTPGRGGLPGPPSARRPAHFAEVVTGRTVWRTIAPAVVHQARQPIPR
jgi:phosphatidylethanolamine/phosphatidyl-N-methylethanolamine N-methyltransferase